MDNETLLFDRIEMIKLVINKYGEENFYISFSGGKDSTVLHYLMDEALPNNKIERVFINTGLEFVDIVKFVKSFCQNDDRFVIINNERNIKLSLEEYGYPFKSKMHSKKVSEYQRNGLTMSPRNYLNGTKSDGTGSLFKCPNCLKYQFTCENDLKISEKCCELFKKQNFHKYEKQTTRKIPITGVRMSEGGSRANHHECVIYDKKRNIKVFNPLNPVTDDWMDWYIKQRDIELCKLYYPPFNFERTGCEGCPFAIKLKEQLDVMEELLPAERKQCEYIWKPVYDEYRRIGYRKMSEGKDRHEEKIQSNI